jgi:hypothetical protein
MKKTTYRVVFSVNHGGTIGAYGPYYNKKLARQEVRKIAEGNCPGGSTATWVVQTFDGCTVYKGKIQNRR